MKKPAAILGTLALVAGGAALVFVAERNGWVPGSPPRAGAAACPHTLARTECPFCTPELVESEGPCVEHGVPEALCSRCDPRLVAAFKAARDWCVGHSLPESQCTICNPGLLSAGGPASRAEAPPASLQVIDVAAEGPRNQRPPSVVCRTETLRVQLVSGDIARDAGLEYARVERREVSETLTGNAELTYDGNRYAHLSSRAAGVVHAVKKDLGQRVERGETLAVIDSAELGAAKAEYLHAAAQVALWERTHARERSLLERRVASERDVLEAETRLTESRIALARAALRLRNLGLSDSQVRATAMDEDASSRLALAAPFAGVVVERSAVAGELVGTGAPLFAIADTAQMWATIDVYEADLRRVAPGQAVVLELDGLPGEPHGGRVTWISSHVDRRTRTLKVRAEIDNRTGLLRDGMFARAIVRVRERAPVLTVPKDAVQWEGCCNVVFVRRSDILLEPRKVRLGYETERRFVVEEGIEEGETVVTTGSFLLKTEILKGSIGAGCCEVAPGKR